MANIPEQLDPEEYTGLDKAALRAAGLPEDKPLTEHQAYWLMVSLMED